MTMVAKKRNRDEFNLRDLKNICGSLKLLTDCCHDDPMGAAMFDHVSTRPLVASAASISSVFAIDLHDTGVAQQSSVFGACRRR